MGLKVPRRETDAFVRSLAPDVRRHIRKALSLLAEDLRTSRLDIKRLDVDGAVPFYRVRVGDYRIVYSIRGDHGYVHRIFHRRDGYGWLDRL